MTKKIKMSEMVIRPTEDGGYHVESHSDDSMGKPKRYSVASKENFPTALLKILDESNEELTEVVDEVMKKKKDKKSLDKFLAKE